MKIDTYDKAIQTGKDLVAGASNAPFCERVAGEILFLSRLLGSYRLAPEIDRLQRYIAGEGYEPDYAGSVEGREEEIQADGIIATILTISSRFSDSERPDVVEQARAAVEEWQNECGLWGARMLALVEQEREIMYRIEHDYAPV